MWAGRNCAETVVPSARTEASDEERQQAVTVIQSPSSGTVTEVRSAHRAPLGCSPNRKERITPTAHRYGTARDVRVDIKCAQQAVARFASTSLTVSK